MINLTENDYFINRYDARYIPFNWTLKMEIMKNINGLILNYL